jgi:hypothetical protein
MTSDHLGTGTQNEQELRAFGDFQAMTLGAWKQLMGVFWGTTITRHFDAALLNALKLFDSQGNAISSSVARSRCCSSDTPAIGSFTSSLDLPSVIKLPTPPVCGAFPCRGNPRPRSIPVAPAGLDYARRCAGTKTFLLGRTRCNALKR